MLNCSFIVPSRKDNKGNPRQTFTPFLQFRHDGKQMRWKTMISVPASLWTKQGVSTSVRRIKDAGWSMQEVTTTNSRLDQLKSELLKLYGRELLEEQFDMAQLKAQWEAFRDGKELNRRKRSKAKTMSLQDMVLACIEHKQKRPQATTVNNKPISPATVSNYMQMHGAVAAFDASNKSNTMIGHVDLEWYDAFVAFMWDKLKLTGQTPGKIVRNLKTALKWADQQGMPVCRDYTRSEFCEPRPTEDAEPMDAVLSWDEIAKLRELDLSGTAEIARDLFCISCYTGMRASDLERLDKVRVVQSKRGPVLQWKPQKAKARPVSVPMRREIREIYERWDNKPPTLAAQSINNHIKAICKAAGLCDKMEGPMDITVDIMGKARRRKVMAKQPRFELVTCHSGRRSFCTNWFDDLAKYPNLNVEQIMRWSGHKKRDTFFLYINREPVDDGEAGFDFVD